MLRGVHKKYLLLLTHNYHAPLLPCSHACPKDEMTEPVEIPEEEVRAMLAAQVRGIEAEVEGLEQLLDGLTIRQERTCDVREQGKLVDVLTSTASRLSELRDAEELILEAEQVAPWVFEILDMIDRVAARKGDPELGVKARAEALGTGPDRNPQERQIATVRCSLRRMLVMALAAQELNEHLRLVEVYARGCIRLMRMLKKEALAPSRAEQRLREAMKVAVRSILNERRPDDIRE